jgi:catechol 2,3-dioxygenase-like lactoylglutathione lyase family enzyme
MSCNHTLDTSPPLNQPISISFVETRAMQKFFYNTIPFLPVRDIRETIRYYKTHLGFKEEWFWGEPPTDAGCHRDELSLLFKEDPLLSERIQGFELVMFVDDVDGIYKEFKTNPDIEIAAPIKDEPWGIREFTIRDINGYLLRISCSLERINKFKKNKPEKVAEKNRKL